MGEWLKVCYSLQCLDSFRRRATTHIELEDRRWQPAITLIVEIEGASADLITNALLPVMNKCDNWSLLDERNKRGQGLVSSRVSSSAGDLAHDRLVEFFGYKKQAVRACLFQALETLEAWVAAKDNETMLAGRSKDALMTGRPSAIPVSPVAQELDASIAINEEMAADINAHQKHQAGPASALSAPNSLNNFFQLFKSAISSSSSSGNQTDVFDTAIKTALTNSSHRATMLGQIITFYGVRHYHVSFAPFSMHLPLQRFISKLMNTACWGGVNLQDLIQEVFSLTLNPPSEPAPQPSCLKAIIALADYPMRTLSWAAQVTAGMWKRNGLAVENLNYNYQRYHFVQIFRNNDIHALQIAGLWLGADAILALAVDRFELTTALEVDSYFPHTKDALKEYRPPLMIELLRLICNYVTAVPTVLVGSGELAHISASSSPTSSAVDPERATPEGIKLAVSREVVHLVIAGEVIDHRTGERSNTGVTFGTLQKIKSTMGWGKGHVTDAILKEVADELCIQQRIGGVNADDEGKIVYELSSRGFEFVDLEYINLSFAELQQASEKVKMHRRRREQQSQALRPDDSEIVYRPIISEIAVPRAHEAFLCTRNMLFRPLFMSLLERLLSLCMRDECRAGGIQRYVIALVCKVIHLLTLQLHIYDHNRVPAAGLSGEANWSAGVEYPRYYETVFRKVDEALSTNKVAVEGMSVDPHTGCGFGVLKFLAEVWTKKLLMSDECYEAGLGWLLSQWFSRSVYASDYLQSVGITFASKANVQVSASSRSTVSSNASGSSADGATNRAASLQKKRAAAQQRALAALNKQATAFSNSFAGEIDADDETNKASRDDTSLTTPSTNPNNAGNDPSPGFSSTASPELSSLTPESGAMDCILCREKSGETIGHLCYAFPTMMLARAHTESDISDPLVNRMKYTYRVVCLEGVDVFAEKVDFSSQSQLVPARLVGHLQQGEHVLLATHTNLQGISSPAPSLSNNVNWHLTARTGVIREGHWVYVRFPVQGWAKLFDTINTQSDTALASSGASSQDNSLKNKKIVSKGIVYLRPVLDLMFSRHGPARLQITSCGHAMHWNCWNSFCKKR
jgi:hypothetical protein